LLTQTDPTLLEDLRGLLDSTTLVDPMRPLLWVSKSHEKLALALRDMGHGVSASRIPQLLEPLGYCRQVNRKSLEGGQHVDRNAQFEFINAQAERFGRSNRDAQLYRNRATVANVPLLSGAEGEKDSSSPVEATLYG
jgi:DDE family transposase